MADEVVIRIKAVNLTQKEFSAAQKQLNALGKQAGLTQGGFTKLGAGVRGAATELASFTPGVSRFSGALTALGPAGLAAGAGIGAIVAAATTGIGHVVSLGDEITTLADKTGLSTDFLQKLKIASDQLDVSFEGATKAVSRLQVEIGKNAIGSGTAEAARAVEALGLSFKELERLDAESQFRQVADSIRALQDPTQQAAVAQALFGRQGLELLPLLRGEYAEVIQTAEDLGLVLGKDVLDAGDALGENWNLLKTLGVSLLGEAVSPLVIELNKLTSSLLDAVKATREAHSELGTMKSVLDTLGSVMPFLTGGSYAFAAGIAAVRGELEQVPAAASEAEQAAQLAALGFGNLGASMSGTTAVTLEGILADKERADSQSELARFLGISKDKLDDLPPSILAEAEAMLEAKNATEEHEKSLKENEKVSKELAKAAEEAAQAERELAEAQREALAAGNEQFESLKRQADELARFRLQIAPADTATGLFAGGPFEQLLRQQEVLAKEGFKPAESAIDGSREAMERLGEEIRDATFNMDEFAESAELASDLLNIIPGTLGKIVSGIVGGGGALKSLTSGGIGGIFGGIGEAFSAGKGSGTGILGLIGGIAGAAGPIGQLVSVGLQLGKPILDGIKKIFSIGGPDIARDAGRDLGATLSEALEEQILKSGQNVQLFLNEIFAEGGIGIDRFAEEVGDLFSFFERGEISEGTLISELKETLPILIQNFEELGPAGEEQVQRIAAAAERLGFSLEEIDALMQQTFAPQTMEEIAAAFGLTNDEVRALSETLGIQIQTDLERLAASVGLTAAEFQSLGAALEAQFGIPAEQLAEFLEATGVSAAELAETLGVEVGEGAATVAEGQAAANEEIDAGIGLANSLADALERAARAAGGIHIPSTSGTSAEAIGMAHGGIGETTSPTLFRTSEHGQREGFAFFPGGLPQGGGGEIVFQPQISVSVNPQAITTGGARELIRDLEPALEEALSSGTLRGKLLKVLSDSGIRGPRA